MLLSIESSSSSSSSIREERLLLLHPDNVLFFRLRLLYRNNSLPFLCACRNDPQTLVLVAPLSTKVRQGERMQFDEQFDPFRAPPPLLFNSSNSIRWDFYIKVVGYLAVAPSEQTSFQEATDHDHRRSSVASMTVAVRTEMRKGK